MFRFLCLNAFIGLNTVIFCIWGILISLFDKNGIIIHRYAARPWAKTILWVCGVKLVVRGLENLKYDSPQIFMSNHQSFFDIFVLLAGLPVDFKFILKKELMKIPLFGTAMRRARYISIDREDPRTAILSMNEAAEIIKTGAYVLIFPEGTRSVDGNVQDLKKGGFHLAMKSECDIIPLGVVKSRDIAPKGSLRIKKGTVFLNIGKAIRVKEYSKSMMDILLRHTRESIIGLVKQEG
ncbi:MAG: 1-acyl-sn-glycerol-3-phosphate acyltransferase [Deltaproteobacteria bacterium]|nr:1-acyl-sn-glycerol-3-phosphate acyltransferase [Deltaproteobacteria bacterium]